MPRKQKQQEKEASKQNKAQGRVWKGARGRGTKKLQQ
jgi:hypothetical protein